jgi:hypothetical protein
VNLGSHSSKIWHWVEVVDFASSNIQTSADKLEMNSASRSYGELEGQERPTQTINASNKWSEIAKELLVSRYWDLYASCRVGPKGLINIDISSTQPKHKVTYRDSDVGSASNHHDIRAYEVNRAGSIGVEVSSPG